MHVGWCWTGKRRSRENELESEVERERNRRITSRSDSETHRQHEVETFGTGFHTPSSSSLSLHYWVLILNWIQIFAVSISLRLLVNTYCEVNSVALRSLFSCLLCKQYTPPVTFSWYILSVWKQLSCLPIPYSIFTLSLLPDTQTDSQLHTNNTGLSVCDKKKHSDTHPNHHVCCFRV